jgi:hypothetical protein
MARVSASRASQTLRGTHVEVVDLSVEASQVVSKASRNVERLRNLSAE